MIESQNQVMIPRDDAKKSMGLKQAKILNHYVFVVLKQVKGLLKHWEREVLQCSDTELRKQALSSLHNKAFHCHGGAVFAVPYPRSERVLLELIVAYQTLCDYLDNLCDRANCTDGQAFRQLHESLLDAIQPDKDITVNYYEGYPMQDDSGYIEKLVQECRTCIKHLPSYSIVQDDLMKLVQLYIDLQVYKHIDQDWREEKLITWANQHLKEYPRLHWQEFSAACGSTLGIFALFGLASMKHIENDEAVHVVDVYFPWVCGLHILLDYLIDQQEDKQGGDLNFTFYYQDQEEMIDRMKIFIDESLHLGQQSINPLFHKTVVEGLLAMYLSDGKVREQGYEHLANDLLKTAGGAVVPTYRLCSVVRRFF
ncbi:MAG: tetraprenyl-beta-curcumene synthase family protein [Bacillota bacterium]|nr:tetraprenyl-beta-curcumene synthase family protein [Bacillota bacterium]